MHESERKAFQAALAHQTKIIEQLNRSIDVLTALDSAKVTNATPWPTPAKKSTEWVGIANLMLSDLHLDEVIDPDQVGGCNAYNRVIALQRLKRCIERTIRVSQQCFAGITYEGIQVWLNGDLFSGTIHEELKETNETMILDSVDYWLDPMASVLVLLADCFHKVNVSVRVGNHGRQTRKPIAKNRVIDNYDYLFGRLLSRELKGDDRISWDIPLSADGLVTQYNTVFLATHGDQFHGGSGISGIQTPLALGDYKKRKRQASVGEPYDVMLLGHFHQLLWMPGVIVNGSLKGYDEYAYLGNFGFEVPQQAFWITTPEQGVTFQCAIRPMDRKDEKW